MSASALRETRMDARVPMISNMVTASIAIAIASGNMDLIDTKAECIIYSNPHADV